MFIWDDTKNTTNIAKHGLAFDAVQNFDWDNAVIMDRSRPAIDGEIRLAAVSKLYGKLHTVIYTIRNDAIRVISLRRSNTKEEATYDRKTHEN